jgi:hypothetical protein
MGRFHIGIRRGTRHDTGRSQVHRPHVGRRPANPSFPPVPWQPVVVPLGKDNQVKYWVGLTRVRKVSENAHQFVGLSGDVLEFDVADDGSEYVSNLWIGDENGSLLVQLPLDIMPGRPASGE